jgi:hypothetical protein
MRQYIQTDHIVFKATSSGSNQPYAEVKRSPYAPGPVGSTNPAEGSDPSKHGVLIAVQHIPEVNGGAYTVLDTESHPDNPDPLAKFTWADVLDQMVAPPREVALNQRADATRGVLENYDSRATGVSQTGWNRRETMPFLNVHNYAGDLSGVDAFCINPWDFADMIDAFVTPVTFAPSIYLFDMHTVYLSDTHVMDNTNQRRVLSSMLYQDGTTAPLQHSIPTTTMIDLTGHHRPVSGNVCDVYDEQTRVLLRMGQHNVYPNTISMSGVVYHRSGTFSTEDWAVWVYVLVAILSVFLVASIILYMCGYVGDNPQATAYRNNRKTQYSTVNGV